MNPATPERKLIHTRHVECRAYLREDGLVEVEGEMRDVSPDGTDLFFKQVAADGLIHRMRIVMTVGSDMVIRAVAAKTIDAPTPYCPAIESAYAALAGLEIGVGFTLGLKSRVGGIKGCTHLTELLAPMATTAFQAFFAMQRSDPARWKRLRGDGPLPRPRVADTCHAYRMDGEALAIFWPKHRRQIEDRTGEAARPGDA
jgi:hypothetical protein